MPPSVCLCSITNLKYWGGSEPIITRTLQLLNDLSVGYSSVRKLVKLDAVQFMLDNHRVSSHHCSASSSVACLSALSFLDFSVPAVPNCCCFKGLVLYWSSRPFLIFDIRALWHSVMSARSPECQKLRMVVRPIWQSLKP